MSSENTPIVKAFFDEDTFTFSYIVQDSSSDSCAIIDPVLNFDYSSGRTSTRSADEILEWVETHGLTVEWILETHVHADHLSGACYLKEKTGACEGIGDQISVVQQVFGDTFNAGDDFIRDGSQFDRLFHDGDTFAIGELEGRVLHTPGHTPACVTYLIGDAAFVGDTLFMPDFGTARCDFPGGDARTLYNSIQRILQLPARTRIYLCHDYQTPERTEYLCETSVTEQRNENIHVHDGISEEEFVQLRVTRDATLEMPALIIPSVQINMRAGRMPTAEDNGQVYLKVPINLL